MARKVAPTKVTGGGGFDFEDKVTAYYICCLLLARPPLETRYGSIAKISLQVRADGLLIDDLLLHLSHNGKMALCPFSIKSNTQFSKISAPSDFVMDVWEQYLGEVDSEFKQNRDLLGITTTPLQTDTKSNLEDLFGKARSQDAKDLSKRIEEAGYVSKESVKLYKSFSCPNTLAKKHSIDKTATGDLLKHIIHVEFDFENTASKNKSEAIGMMKEILDDGAIGDAENLWDTLCSIARSVRASGGDIDLGYIVREIRNRYKLRDFPEYTPDWEIINRFSTNALELIPDKISDSIKIDRSKEYGELIDDLEIKRLVVMLGESGCGKTVIEKEIALAEFEKTKVVWINPETVSFLQKIKSFDVFKVVTDKNPLLVIDGIDRFNDLTQVALLLKACKEETDSPWKILVSSQPDDWARVSFALSRLNFQHDFLPYVLKNPEHKLLTPVWDKYPALKSLSLHEHLRSFLYKPKVLDLFARNLDSNKGIDAQAFNSAFTKEDKIGESHLISWYWEHEIEMSINGLKKSVLLQRISETLADELIYDISAKSFNVEDISTIQELTADRILACRENSVLFEHDLISGWARLRILLDKSISVSDYLKDRLSSPLWCRTLRLLGVYKLERSNTVDDWMELFESFSTEGKVDNLAQDLLLEAAVFSSDLKNNLDKLWGKLTSDEGKLLRRLLKRFKYSASFPNEMTLLIARQYPEESMSGLIAENRDPYWLYWWPMIQYLYLHKEDAIKYAKILLAEIVDKWLRFSKPEWPVRKEAAEIAIEIAEDELAINKSEIINVDSLEIAKPAYRAGVAAYTELPDRVKNFLLTVCSRQAPSGRVLELIGNYNEQVVRKKRKQTRKQPVHAKVEAPAVTLFPLGPKPDPWPEGPIERVDHNFHELCLSHSVNSIDIINPIIINDPDLASEIILAILIEEPTPKESYSSPIREDVGLSYVHGWFPPFYTRGQFYFFLNNHPDKGVEFIIKLVNFVTERWAENREAEGNNTPHIEISLPSTPKIFIGDAYVYYWHRDVGHVPEIIASALMALEKWLYDACDNDKTDKVEALIRTILEKGRSLAFIGLLVSIGKKKIGLYLDLLMPLLSIPEIHSWDIEHIYKSESHQQMGWSGNGDYLQKAAKEFNELEHRKYSVTEIAKRIYLLQPKTREKFDGYRSEWIERFESGDLRTVSSDVFENLIHWFDISNYKITKVSGGTQYDFIMPQEIAREREAALKQMQDDQLLNISPMHFRMMLDGDSSTDSLDATQVWETIQRIEAINQPESDIDPNERVASSICGGIAVLFKQYRKWLEDNPNNKSWCIDKITNLIFNPPANSQYDSSVSLINWNWDRFCAEIIPQLWAEEPEQLTIKECVIALAMNNHYETVEILVKTASWERDKLGPHFAHLLNFIIYYSIENRQTHHFSPNSAPPTISKAYFALASLFKNPKCNLAKSTHTKLVDNANNRWEKHDIKSRQRSIETLIDKFTAGDLQNTINVFDINHEGGSNFDQSNVSPYLLFKIFKWMPHLDKSLNKDERSEWIQFWAKAIQWTIDNIAVKEDGDYSGTPSDWDAWVFKQIAIQLLYLEDNESPYVLWQSIIDMGPEGHYWVDDFFIHLFIYGIGYETNPSNFIKRWQEILEYTFKSEKWHPSRSRFWYHRNKLWCELLGMGYSTLDLWGKEKSNIVQKIKPYYERWAVDFLPDTESAEHFIHFLQKPAAVEILLDGLVWLDNASNISGEAFFTDRHHKTQQPLANLLDVSWKKYHKLIKEHDGAYKSYKNLLKKLINLQNLQAIEIQKHLLT